MIKGNVQGRLPLPFLSTFENPWTSLKWMCISVRTQFLIEFRDSIVGRDDSSSDANPPPLFWKDIERNQAFFHIVPDQKHFGPSLSILSSCNHVLSPSLIEHRIVFVYKNGMLKSSWTLLIIDITSEVVATGVFSSTSAICFRLLNVQFCEHCSCSMGLSRVSHFVIFLWEP